VVADIFEGRSIKAALKRIAREGRGVLVYLRDGTAGVPTTTFAEAESASETSRQTQWREIGLGAQILRDLGVVSIRNLATSSRSYVGLSGFGIELLGDEPLEV
jgi:3,4-dihydroxy 2-butanone 4-phosphate synthase/GTP cyclohydrolase II